MQVAGFLMPAKLSSQVSEAGDTRYSMQSTGLDHVTFQLAAASNEPFRPLAEVASGGESARIMLAMKAAPLTIATADDGASTGILPLLTPPVYSITCSSIHAASCSCILQRSSLLMWK